MRIVYLSKEYPPYGLNFASALFYPKLAKALVKRGHEVYVVSQAVNGKECYEDQGVVVYRVGPTPRYGSGITRMMYNSSAWLKLRELIKKNRIDLVDAPVTFAEGFIYSIFKQTPLVLQTFAFSDMFIETKSYNRFGELVSFWISSYLEDISLKRADKIIANSSVTYDYLVKRKRVSPEKIELILEARIDLDIFRFRKSDIRKRLGIPSNSPLILYVGWLQARKGPHILLKAIPYVLRHFPSALFVYLGRDTNTALKGQSFKKYILETSKQHGFLENVVIIEDFLSTDELVELYSACDVFVLPSLSETFGWPTIEAMACGKPVVATRTGIASELEGLTPGLKVVRPGDAQSLAKAIVEFLTQDSTHKREASLINRRIVEEKFSFEKMVEQIISVYKECIGRKT
jgi:glycosyltransferase involved in cell wall biosynthesis